MRLSTAPRSIQCVLVSRRSAARPSCARPSGHCVRDSGSDGTQSISSQTPTQLGRPVLRIAHGPAELAKEQAMNILTQRLPGLPVGLLRMMFGILWLQAALQKAPWVINAQGQRFGWLSNWIWQEIQHPTFQFYKAFLETVVFPNSTLHPF